RPLVRRALPGDGAGAAPLGRRTAARCPRVVAVSRSKLAKLVHSPGMTVRPGRERLPHSACNSSCRLIPRFRSVSYTVEVVADAPNGEEKTTTSYTSLRSCR